MSPGALATLTVDGMDALRVLGFRGREALHAPLAFEVTCAPADPQAALDPGALGQIASAATLSWASQDGAERVIRGVTDEITVEEGALRITLVPRVALAESAEDYRVFVDKDAVEIAREVLDKHGIGVDLRLMRELPKRPQCVQMFEGDLDFVSRILAEEGIAWRSKHDDPDTLVLADSAFGYDELGGDPLPFVAASGMRARECVFAARIARGAVNDKVTLRDYDFERPVLDQTAEASSGGDARERYEYPGGYRSPDVGRELAQIRLEELQQRQVVLTGRTNARRLFPGAVFTLAEAPREDMNGPWLVVELEHDAQAEGESRTYVARFTAVPGGGAYRAPRRPAPRHGGVHSAVITGPTGGEIHTEPFGRVKLHHRWDRLSPSDDTSSAWVRVAQPPTSGAIFLPRVSWEVLLGYQAGAGDDPVVLGRLYNGAAPPPRGLPAAKVVYAFGTQTTKQGGGGNLVAMDDTAGNEAMSFVASRAYNERTENDKVTAIKVAHDAKVGGARKLLVGKVLQQAVTGAHAVNVSGSRTLNIGANLTHTGSSESVLVGGLRYISTGGDYATSCTPFFRIVLGAEVQTAIEHYHRFVQGVALVALAGSWITVAGLHASVGVLGGTMLRVSGAKNIRCGSYGMKVSGALTEKYSARSVRAGGSIEEQFGAMVTYDIRGAATLKGSEVVFEATSQITIKASGGIEIAMTPGSIRISGKFKGDVASVEEGEFTYG